MIGSPTDAIALLIVGLVGYLVGSISSGYIVGRIYRNVDLRKVGDLPARAARDGGHRVGQGRIGLVQRALGSIDLRFATLFDHALFLDPFPALPSE